MRIALCDDALCREEVAQLVREYMDNSVQIIDLTTYERGSDLLEDVQSTGSFDIYILDVLMPRLSGIDLGKQLRELDTVCVSELAEQRNQGLVHICRHFADLLHSDVYGIERSYPHYPASRTASRVPAAAYAYAGNLSAHLQHPDPSAKNHEVSQQENILRLQAANMRSRIDEFSAANDLLREERHDFRHKMRTIAALAETGDWETIRHTAKEYVEAFPERSVECHCDHKILDAVLSSYLEWAKRKGIRVITKLIFPEEFPVNEAELATALANALENAIHACEKLEPPKRYIEVNSTIHPCWMIQIRNSFDGVIAFNEAGLPLTAKKGHGFGTRSIATFCDKNNGFYEFLAEEKEFTVRLVFN